MAIEWAGLFANTGYSSANNKAQDDAVVGMQDTLYVTGPGYGAYEAIVRLHSSTGAVVATVNISGGGGAFSAPPPVRFVDNGAVYSYSLEVLRGYIPTEDANGIVIRLVGGASKRYPSPMSVTPSGDVQFGGAVIAPPSVGASGTNRVALFGNSIGVDSYMPVWSQVTAGPWQPSTGVVLNAIVHPASIDLRAGVPTWSYKCTTAGTSGATEPVWPLVTGGTVIDGSIVWTAVDDGAQIFQRPGGWNFAQALSGQKFDEVFMAGATGQASSVILSYREKALLAGPNIMAYLHMFENDVIFTATMAELIEDVDAFEAVVKDDLKNGRRVIVGTCLPRALIDSSSAFTGYVSGLQTQMWHYVNARVRAIARLQGVYLADISEAYIDPNWARPVYPDNVTTFALGSGGTVNYTSDGTHPRVPGHWAIAKILAKTLEEIPCPKFGFAPSGVGEMLALNPYHYGTGGTGTNVAGTIADKRAWYCAIAGATASTVARTDGINGKVQRVVGSFAASSVLSCIQSEYMPTTPALMANVWQGCMEVTISANPTGLQQVQCGLAAPGRSMAVYAWSTPLVSTLIGQFIKEDTVLYLKTLPRKYPSDVATLTMTPTIETTGAGSAYDIKIGRFGARKAAT